MKAFPRVGSDGNGQSRGKAKNRPGKSKQEVGTEGKEGRCEKLRLLISSADAGAAAKINIRMGLASARRQEAAT